jgi:hypothetical protein
MGEATMTKSAMVYPDQNSPSFLVHPARKKSTEQVRALAPIHVFRGDPFATDFMVKNGDVIERTVYLSS